MPVIAARSLSPVIEIIRRHNLGLERDLIGGKCRPRKLQNHGVYHIGEV